MAPLPKTTARRSSTEQRQDDQQMQQTSRARPPAPERMGRLQAQPRMKPQQKPEQQQQRSATLGKAGTAGKAAKFKPRAASSQEPDPQQLLGEFNADTTADSDCCVVPMLTVCWVSFWSLIAMPAEGTNLLLVTPTVRSIRHCASGASRHETWGSRPSAADTRRTICCLSLSVRSLSGRTGNTGAAERASIAAHLEAATQHGHPTATCQPTGCAAACTAA
jgi:hypothetical protein